MSAAFAQACEILEREGSLADRELWRAINGDNMDPGLALILFDASCRHGAGQAARWLEAAGGDGDPAIGPADPLETLAAFHALRVREETHADE
jgi:lysozyme family protein